MTKAEEFKMKLKSSFFYFSEKEDYIKCLWHLREAGDMVLKQIKDEEEKKQELNGDKLL